MPPSRAPGGFFATRPPGAGGRRPPPGHVAELTRLATQALSGQVATAAACTLAAPRPRDPATVLHENLLGTACRPPPLLRLQEHTRFDLGSLTQSLVVSTITAVLVSRGRLDLGRTLGQFAGDLAPQLKGGPWQDIPLAHLLDHTSGLPDAAAPLAALHRQNFAATPPPVLSAVERARLPQRRSTRQPAEVVRSWGGPLDAAQTLALKKAIAAIRPLAPPGQAARPSPLNALALGWALEGLLGEPLDVAFARLVTEPLGLGDALSFVRCGPHGPWQAEPAAIGTSRVAAYGTCPWRRRKLHGECLDATAYLLGGVAGHAGLFGSAAAVRQLLSEQLACLEGRSRWLGAGVVQRFWSRSKVVGDGTHAMGWQLVGRHNGLLPGRWNARSVGAVCPQGNVAFVDPAFGVVGVVLMNLAEGTAPERQATFQKLYPRLFDIMASEGQHLPTAVHAGPIKPRPGH